MIPHVCVWEEDIEPMSMQILTNMLCLIAVLKNSLRMTHDMLS
jgi:hypothetical protein